MGRVYRLWGVKMKEKSKFADKQLFFPIIALAFTFMPTILMLLSFIPIIGIIFAYIFAITFWGAYLHIIGVTIGIVYFISQVLLVLFKKRKRINLMGVIFAIVSILVPIIRWTIVIILHYKGYIELYL